MIGPMTPGIGRTSAAMKKASFGAMSGGRNPPDTSARATQPPDATTTAAMGMRTSIMVIVALRLSCTERADMSRKDLLVLIAAGSAALASPDLAAPEELDTRPVVVFGAGGYTGGDTIRSLLKKGRTVIPVTRRPVQISSRDKGGADTLVLDDVCPWSGSADGKNKPFPVSGSR